jgi:hypothetical protein
MSIFEWVFWPLWLAAIWFLRDGPSMRFQMWFVDWQLQMFEQLKPKESNK